MKKNAIKCDECEKIHDEPWREISATLVLEPKARAFTGATVRDNLNYLVHLDFCDEVCLLEFFLKRKSKFTKILTEEGEFRGHGDGTKIK